MSTVDPPSIFAEAELRDDGGRRRSVFFAYADDDPTRPVASIVFKDRRDIPEYSMLRGPEPVAHLGQAPPVGSERDYDAWRPSGEGTGMPHYIVDVTPIGVVELAYRLSGDPQWGRLAAEMREGR